MSGRPAQILARFPAHLEAARPDKQIAFVTAELAAHLDLLSADLADVRRAHRLAHAGTARDLGLLAGYNGIGAEGFDVLRRKQASLLGLAAALEGASDAKARDAAAVTLLALFAIDPAVDGLVLARPAPTSTRDDAAKNLVAMVRDAVSFAPVLEAMRARIGSICRIHAGGNGTVRALIAGAANALDLDLDETRNRAVRAALMQNPTSAAELHPTVDDGLFHSADLFVHSTFVRDRLALPLPAAGVPPLPVVDEVLGVEENPLRREFWPAAKGTPPTPITLPLQDQGTFAVGARWRFHIQRRGFGRELLQIEVTGIGDKTVGPMLVNRDEGRGIGWVGNVPDGKVLRFTEEGRALLDGADVTSYAFSWQGGCFAMPTVDSDGGDDEENVTKHDFVFGGLKPDDPRVARVATFAVTSPPGALDRGAGFPHAGDAVVAPGVGVGRTRFAFFLQEAHLSGDLQVTPRTSVAFAGDRDHPNVFASVFAMSPPPPDAVPPPAAAVSLSWREHEAYAARVWIPKRFASLDGEGLPVKERVRLALDRFRPAGVHVTVEYIDDTWVLGSGVLTGENDPDPNLEFTGGTVLPPRPSP